MIFFTNSVSILLHTFLTAPEASEAARGYLHGGLLVDFIGELGPISKFKLFLLDILTTCLQLFVLAAVLEKRDLVRKITNRVDRATGVTVIDQGQVEDVGQGHNAEERGLFPSDGTPSQGLEMKTLGSDEGRQPVLGSSPLSQRLSRDEHHLDQFRTGQYLLANLDILDIVRRPWW
jgi:hypothetical protein